MSEFPVSAVDILQEQISPILQYDMYLAVQAIINVMAYEQTEAFAYLNNASLKDLNLSQKLTQELKTKIQRVTTEICNLHEVDFESSLKNIEYLQIQFDSAEANTSEGDRAIFEIQEGLRLAKQLVSKCLQIANE